VSRLAALALLLAACETSLPQCPGTHQGAFVFELTSGAASCAFSFPGSVSPPPGEQDGTRFTAVVSFLPDGGAALCVQKTLASPMLGTRSGDELSLASPEATLNVGSCPCQLVLQEAVSGRVLRDGAGAATGFEGVAVDTLRLSGDPGCDAAAAVCPPPADASGASLCCPLAGPAPSPSCEFRFAVKTL
jgi:hypothetical protein